MDSLITEIKKKKEFALLPDSIIERTLETVDSSLDLKSRVKETRAILRKYYGVFLTNRVLKPKNIVDYDSVLRSHKSSYKRNYDLLYDKIKKALRNESVKSVIDLGCGMNGFSYDYMKKYFGSVNYLGVEASGQIVTLTNLYFEEKKVSDTCKLLCDDLFNFHFIERILKDGTKPRLAFLFQVVDAMESVKKDSSKEFLRLIKKYSEYVVVSVSLKSISGKKSFEAKRMWLTEFLHDTFEILDEFEMFDEKFFILKC